MQVSSYILLVLLTFLQNAICRSNNLARLMKITPSCHCGKRDPQPPGMETIETRIVNGKEVEAHSFPWMVAIFNNGRIHCGGSLINNRYVLTAGHCVNWSNKDDLTAIIGMHDRLLMENEKKGGIELKIEKMILHEDFSSDYLHDSDDIALLKLAEPVSVLDHRHVATVCLPHKGSGDYHDELATVTGWGKTGEKSGAGKKLMQTNLRIMQNSECQKVNTIGDHIISGMMCAYENNTDACQGDSGGPLVLESKGRTEQVGVVSWGIGCGRPGMPGIFTRTTAYLEWIIAHTRDAEYCTDPAD